MASMGSLVVDLQANTRQFDQAIQRSRQTMTGFAQGAKQAATTGNAIQQIKANTQTATHLKEVETQIQNVSEATTEAANRWVNFENAAHVAIAAVGPMFANSASVIGQSIYGISHAFHTITIGAVAVKRTIESLIWKLGYLASGAKALLIPLNILGRALQILSYPFRV